MVKVVITKDALRDLKNIRYKYKNYPSKDNQIRNHITKGYKTLETFPAAGPIEPLYEDSINTYRSLVVDENYKHIYYIEKDIVYIAGIWNCRQNPAKMFERFM